MNTTPSSPAAATSAPLELWDFSFSMYPEKLRWALDFKKIPHRRHTLMPGPHALKLYPRFKQKSLPVLVSGDIVLKDSVPALAWLEQKFPAPALLPNDPGLKVRALAVAKKFDALGPITRRALFAELLPHAEYMAEVWSAGQPEAARTRYRAMFPWLVRPLMKLSMGITAAGAHDGRQHTRTALDFVAQHSRETGYLAGARFTLADLTAATILATTVVPPELGLPQPQPAGLLRWQAYWKGHPGLDYVRRIWRDHRGSSAAVP